MGEAECQPRPTTPLRNNGAQVSLQGIVNCENGQRCGCLCKNKGNRKEVLPPYVPRLAVHFYMGQSLQYGCMEEGEAEFAQVVNGIL